MNKAYESTIFRILWVWCQRCMSSGKTIHYWSLILNLYHDSLLVTYRFIVQMVFDEIQRLACAFKIRVIRICATAIWRIHCLLREWLKSYSETRSEVFGSREKYTEPMEKLVFSRLKCLLQSGLRLKIN